MDPLEHLRMLQDRAAGNPPRNGDFRRIRALRSTLPGFDRAAWQRLCAGGGLGLRGPQDRGGSSRGTRSLCALAQALGSQLAPEPLMTAAMAAELLPADRLPAVLTGERIVLPAWQETPDSLCPAGETLLRHGRLTGRKLLIPMAAGADAFLVTLPEGLALVERDASGLRLELHPTPDGGHHGTLTLDGAPAEVLDGDGNDALEACILATGAYLFGLLERAFAIARESPAARARANAAQAKAAQASAAQANAAQPGDGPAAEPPLTGGAADIEVQLALTRAALNAGIDGMREQHRAARQAAVSRAKLRVWDAALVVTRACVQLHGGLAHTDATDIGLFLPKVLALAPLYGPVSTHRRRLRAPAPETTG